MPDRDVRDLRDQLRALGYLDARVDRFVLGDAAGRRTAVALAAAASGLAGIGSAMNAGSAAAAGPTSGVVAAAADEVSALTAAQFAAHAQMYQAVAAQAAAIHEQFVSTLGVSSASYAATEVANAAAAG